MAGRRRRAHPPAGDQHPGDVVLDARGVEGREAVDGRPLDPHPAGQHEAAASPGGRADDGDGSARAFADVVATLKAHGLLERAVVLRAGDVTVQLTPPKADPLDFETTLKGREKL